MALSRRLTCFRDPRLDGRLVGSIRRVLKSFLNAIRSTTSSVWFLQRDTTRRPSRLISNFDLFSPLQPSNKITPTFYRSTLFISNKILAFFLVVAAVSSDVHAEKEAAETFGGGGLSGMSGGLPGISGGLPGMSGRLPGMSGGGLSDLTKMMPGMGGTGTGTGTSGGLSGMSGLSGLSNMMPGMGSGGLSSFSNMIPGMNGGGTSGGLSGLSKMLPGAGSTGTGAYGPGTVHAPGTSATGTSTAGTSDTTTTSGNTANVDTTSAKTGATGATTTPKTSRNLRFE